MLVFRRGSSSAVAQAWLFNGCPRIDVQVHPRGSSNDL